MARRASPLPKTSPRRSVPAAARPEAAAAAATARAARRLCSPGRGGPVAAQARAGAAPSRLVGPPPLPPPAAAPAAGVAPRPRARRAAGAVRRVASSRPAPGRQPRPATRPTRRAPRAPRRTPGVTRQEEIETEQRQRIGRACSLVNSSPTNGVDISATKWVSTCRARDVIRVSREEGAARTRRTCRISCRELVPFSGSTLLRTWSCTWRSTSFTRHASCVDNSPGSSSADRARFDIVALRLSEQGCSGNEHRQKSQYRQNEKSLDVGLTTGEGNTQVHQTRLSVSRAQNYDSV